MISFTTQQTRYGDFSNNKSSDNLARGAILANIEHRYLLQKYFNNEGAFSITTVGSQNLTATGALAVGATSLTLTSAWQFYTTTVLLTFSSGELRNVNVEKNSTTVTWDAALTQTATTALSFGGVQFYPAPPNYSRLKDVTISTGSLKWVPTQILTRSEWDRMNVFPYYADIPTNFFIYPGGDKGVQIGIWPIPATTGNVITYNYKFRIPDLAIADYTTGSVSVNNGSTTVTGSGTAWTLTTNEGSESRWIQFAPTSSSTTSGDNLWYQIASVDSATSLTLFQPYQGTSITSSSTYTIGQMPLLMEDFQDMLVWKPLMIYFSTIVEKPEKFKQFEMFYNEKLKSLDEYAGRKTSSVNLGRRPLNRNPNLYVQSIGS